MDNRKFTKCVLHPLLLGVMFQFLWTPFARAQKQDQYKQEVLRLYKQGRQLAVQKKYGSALIKLKAALALFQQMIKASKDPKQQQALERRRTSLLFIIGRTHQLNQQPVEAYQTYQLGLSYNPPDKLKAMLQKQTNLLFPTVASTLVVRSTPGQATVTVVDSNQKTYTGVTPFTQKLPPGNTRLTLQRAHHLTQKHTLTLQAKATLTKSYTLQTAPATLVLNTVPPKAIVELIDSQKKVLQGVTPYRQSLSPGTYKISITREGYHPEVLNIKLQAGAHKRTVTLRKKPKAKPKIKIITKKIKMVPPPTRKTAQILGWTFLGLAVAGIGAGVALWVVGENKLQEFEVRADALDQLERQGKTIDPELRKEIAALPKEGNTFRIAGITTLSIGGAFGLVALGMFIWNGGRDIPAKVSQITPPPLPRSTDFVLKTP